MHPCISDGQGCGGVHFRSKRDELIPQFLDPLNVCQRDHSGWSTRIKAQMALLAGECSDVLRPSLHFGILAIFDERFCWCPVCAVILFFLIAIFCTRAASHIENRRPRAFSETYFSVTKIQILIGARWPGFLCGSDRGGLQNSPFRKVRMPAKTGEQSLWQ